MALDFLILYEHTVREYESDLLLKLELERRGYTVRIRQLLDAKDLRLFGKDKPEVLVASCMYDNEAINSHVYNNIGRCNKIVNLHWEQMLSDTQEEGDWFNMNGNAKRCVQTCWGKRTGDEAFKNTALTLVDSFLYRIEHKIEVDQDRKSTRLNSSHPPESRMPSSA